MNIDLFNVTKQIITSHSDESILLDFKRFSVFLSDLAQDVPNPQKNALVKCLEHKFAQILKEANDADLAVCKQRLAQRLHEKEGFDLGLCRETIDLLAMALSRLPNALSLPTPPPIPQPHQKKRKKENIVQSKKQDTIPPENDINGNVVFYLSLFLGWLGVDRFYVWKTGSGILKLMTFGGLGIWWLMDLIFILTDQFTDSFGKIIKIQGSKAMPVLCLFLLPCFFLFLVIITQTSKDAGISFTDSRDGKTYKVVKIRTQTWMAENLNYEAEGSKCYDNNPENCDKYGRLYDWDLAMKVCPEGWHLPSLAEWDVLYRYADNRNEGSGGETAAKYLKASHGWNNDWKGNNGNGTNIYGFSALPGGLRNRDGQFLSVGDQGSWWSTSEDDASKDRAYTTGITDTYAFWKKPSKNSDLKSFLYSVRCIKD
jgi:uncharacterized protein (TIGR02145 family)